MAAQFTILSTKQLKKKKSENLCEISEKILQGAAEIPDDLVTQL
jgi:hypothetical protein